MLDQVLKFPRNLNSYYRRMIHQAAEALHLQTHSTVGTIDPSRIQTPKGYKTVWVVKRRPAKEGWLETAIQQGDYVELKIHVERGMGRYSAMLCDYDEGFRYGFSSQSGYMGPRNPLFHIPPREEWGTPWGK